MRVLRSYPAASVPAGIGRGPAPAGYAPARIVVNACRRIPAVTAAITAATVITAAVTAASAIAGKRRAEEREQTYAPAAKVTVIAHNCLPCLLNFSRQRFSPLPLIHNMNMLPRTLQKYAQSGRRGAQKQRARKITDPPQKLFYFDYLPKYLFKRPAKPAP